MEVVLVGQLLLLFVSLRKVERGRLLMKGEVLAEVEVAVVERPL